MKQIVQSYKTGEMKLEEVPRPTVASGMVLVETKASIVSAGTEKMLVDLAKKSLLGKARSRPDLVKKVVDTAKKEGVFTTFRKVRSKLDTPIPLGYSCAGIVRGVGLDVEEMQVGNLVACGGAGYANHSQFNIVPKNLCVRIPNGVDGPLTFEESAFATVGAIALQGVRQAGLTLGESVCVIGLGLMGQITIQLCKAHGCRVIGADIDPKKIELAKQMGVDEATHSSSLDSAVRAFTRGAGADAVIITAAAQGSELVELAGQVSRLKGRVVAVGFVGLDVPRDVYYKKELDLRMSMSYGPGRYDPEYEERGHDYPLPYVRWTEQRNMQTVLDLCVSGSLKLKPLITHKFPFERALDAYELIRSGKEPYLGIILEYTPEEQEQIIRLPASGSVVPEGRIKLGVIGAGNFAKGVLLPRFSSREDVSLMAVTTGRGMTAKAVGDQFKFQYCAENAESVIQSSEMNAVLIATRHNLHGPLVAQALAAGKHVFVEKPLCLSIEELKAVVETLKGIGEKGEGKAPVLMVGFNRRFSPHVRKAAEYLRSRSGPVFAAYTVNAGFIPKDAWVQDPKEGGGRIIGEVCHFVDTLRFLCGAPVQVIQAVSIQTDDQSQVNRDSVAITLKYEDGSVGVINYHALGSSNYPKERIEVASSRSTIVIDDFRRMEIFGGKKEVLKGTQNKGFDAEIEAFAKSLRSTASPPIPVFELIETTLVTFAVHEALNTLACVQLSEFARQHGIPLR